MGQDKTIAGPRKFGTFGGVFTPSTLTILGVIMFLRFGQVVGQSGWAQVVLILLCAKLITTLTAFSISAIATNTRVRGGGAYFLISRSLGVEYGGAIGVMFFLAQAISVSMYVIGFTEALTNVFPDMALSGTAIASVVNLVVFICVFIGAGWTLKLQYGILAILVLALGSFYAGAFDAFDASMFAANRGTGFLPNSNWFTIFALFFPAVTGIMAGVNMSGDLASPSRSIPRGTLAAIIVTALIYLSMGLLLAGSRPREVLTENAFVMLDIAWSPALINAGIFAATISSALGSMMGAPRILQALARDRIFPSLQWFARGSGPRDEPLHATILTFGIAQAAILLGDLNAIAPIITMFFMVTYGTINLACFYESVTNNPSYRPAFRISHWSSALLGAIGCTAVMFLIDPLWATVAIAGMAGLHQIIKRKEIEVRWGDVSSGMAFERARRALLKLETGHYHPRNWRPIILALSGGAWLRNHLTEYAHWLTASRGILSLGQVIIGELDKHQETRQTAEKKLRKFIASEEIDAFPAVVVEDELLSGLRSLLQCHGIGGIKPNTVLLGWSEDPDRSEAFVGMLRLVGEFEKNMVIVRCPTEKRVRWETPEGTIDLWWRGGPDSALMLVLAHLLTQNTRWRGHTIRILQCISASGDVERAREGIANVIERSRIRATPKIIPTDHAETDLRSHSMDAALVMIPFTIPEIEEARPFVEDTTCLIQGFGNVLLVSGAGGVSLAEGRQPNARSRK
ncbi:MAG: amino acid transporter [Verrucomicrobiales bacterium]|jgi:amino acid transporter